MKWMPLCALLTLLPLYANDQLNADDVNTACDRFALKDDKGILLYRACLAPSDAFKIKNMPDDIARQMNRNSGRRTTPDQISGLKEKGPINQDEQKVASTIALELRTALVNCTFRNNTTRR